MNRRFKALTASFLVGLSLAACAESKPETRRLMGARATLEAPAGEAVEILVFDIPPGRHIESVALIDPKGARHLAENLTPMTRESGVGSRGSAIGVGVTGGSASKIRPSLSVGVGLGGLGGADPGYKSLQVLARVPLADPAAFRAETSHAETSRWFIEVIYLEVTGERRSRGYPVASP